MKVAAIILIAGSGQRFGHPLPKQFHRLSGKPVYQHTLKVFTDSKLFDSITLVTHPDYLDQIHESVQVIPGGKTRQESSYLGIQATDADIVLIHDGARPFIDERILKENIEAAIKYGAANTCIPSKDTIVECKSDTIDSIPDRSTLLRGQTPQTFKRDLILKAHSHALSKNITNATDDCQLVHPLSPVHIVQGSENNIKITSELDLFLAEQLMRHHQTITPSNHSLKDKRYAICGGAGGIGTAISKHLEAEGAHPIIIARNANPFSTDCRSLQETKSTFAQIHDLYGPLDGLINCVGKLMIKPVKDLSQEEMQDLINTNLMSTIYTCTSAPLKDNASIINIASSSYFRGRAGYALYSAAKAAVVNFSQALADERPTLRINTLVPSRVNTPMRSANFQETDNLLEPSDVASNIISLLKNQDLTGAVVQVRP